MLATLFLLAQLVLPGPPSGPIQLPGMICASGGCEGGPVVWGPAERGRLVVACDMTSDTCSDGRKITTVRASPVPCEVSPGVWEMVGVNEGCYSVRGLESWAANTSYLSYGAELDREPWGPTQSGVDIQPIGGGAVRVCTTVNNTGIRQYLGNLTEPGIATGAIIARVTPPNTSALIGVFQGVWGIIAHPGPVGSWAQMSFTGEGEVGVRQQLIVYPRPYFADRINCIDIMAAWRTKTATPGRACWGGEAPVTCAADRHTISTEGWPTTEGEIRMVVELNEQLAAGRNAWLFDGRGAGDLMGVNPYIQPDGRLRFRVAGTVYGSTSPILAWEVGRPYALRFLRKGGQTYIYRDGALVYSVATPDWAWFPSAHLGMNFSLTGPDVAIAIRALTVRSYEEVSP